MRKLIVSEFITLDGVIQAPGQEDLVPGPWLLLRSADGARAAPACGGSSVMAWTVVRTAHPGLIHGLPNAEA